MKQPEEITDQTFKVGDVITIAGAVHPDGRPIEFKATRRDGNLWFSPKPFRKSS